MTSLPAQKLGLMDRGLIREGGWADVVVFDPKRVTDEAIFKDPHQYPKGIKYVFVNGEVVLGKEEHTGALCGKVLRIPNSKSQ
jgi:N-acyl-D-amino-acid deacylase